MLAAMSALGVFIAVVAYATLCAAIIYLFVRRERNAALKQMEARRERFDQRFTNIDARVSEGARTPPASRFTIDPKESDA